MSFVRIDATTEYDPATRTLRKDGQIRPAGLEAVGFSTVLEVQQQIRQGATGSAASQPETPAVAPTQRPVTASGAPRITLSEKPVENPWGYTGPAARNPYYITPGIPMRDGFVEGYQNWFREARVRAGGSGGILPEAVHSLRVTTEEGAQEALRLVQEYVPEATLEARVFGSGGGPWAADQPSYQVVLPGGGWLDAAAVLDRYYNRGQGVTALSDLTLRDELRSQTGRPSLG